VTAGRVLRGLRARYPDPLVVEATVADALAGEDVLAGCTIVPQDADPGGVVDAVLAPLAA
jgi:hypothetical protein